MIPRATPAFLHPTPFQPRHAPVIIPSALSWGLSNRQSTFAYHFKTAPVPTTRAVSSKLTSSMRPKVRPRKKHTNPVMSSNAAEPKHQKTTTNSETSANGVQRNQRKQRKSAANAPTSSKQRKKAGRKTNASANATTPEPFVLRRTGLNTPIVLSQPMQQFAGLEMTTRSGLLSVLRRYIRENNLYLEEKRRSFICDERLEALFGVSGEQPLSFLARFMRPHVKSPSEMGEEFERRATEMYQQYLQERGAVEPSSLPKRDRRGMNSREIQKSLQEKGLGMYKDVELATCLRGICGGKARMSRPQVLKTVWQYIKGNGLQNPVNTRKIKVTNSLRVGLDIADRDEIDCFDVTKYVCRLLTPVEEP